jgi:ATP-dependent DNA helicase PIF1
MEFSDSQKKVLQEIDNGHNLFITGAGGCGKTHVVRHLYRKSCDEGKVTHITAMTGVAAQQLHEQCKTLHAWAGIGLGDKDVSVYIDKIMNTPNLMKRWSTVELLIIDEVSMLSMELFEKLMILIDRFCPNVQVIMVGDFYQLPPINTNNFCFESNLFSKFTTIELTTQFRQDDDVLVKLLNNIRRGRITRKNIEMLKSRITPISDDINIVTLMPKKSNVATINAEKLKSLKTVKKKYDRKILNDLPLNKEEESFMKLVTKDDYDLEFNFLKTSTNVSESLELKIGAQVMCTVNIEDEEKLIISNGTQGIVERFYKGLPYIKFDNGVSRTIDYYTWKCSNLPSCGIKQLPIVLSWALTIHKAQGCTIKCCRMNIGDDIFEAGQTYVALSRVKSLDALYLDAFNPHKIQINKKVKEFYDNLKL